MINRICGAEDKTKVSRLTDVIAEYQNDSSLENVAVCHVLTPAEKAEIMAVV